MSYPAQSSGGGLTDCVEMQLVYSTTPTDWAGEDKEEDV